jgi:hypothetical protein
MMQPSDLLSIRFQQDMEEKTMERMRDRPVSNYSGTGYWWNNYPAYIGGTTQYDPLTTTTGSNYGALTPSPGSASLAQEAGLGDGVASGSSVGGTAGY